MAVTQFKGVSSVFQDVVTVVLSAASGAITSSDMSNVQNAPGGLVPITYNGGAGGYTLQAPISGGPSPVASGTQFPAGLGGQTMWGGDDGKILTIVTTTAQAHVVTTPSNKINGSKKTITFTAAVGNSIRLQAYQGVWYAIELNGVTLS